MTTTLHRDYGRPEYTPSVQTFRRTNLQVTYNETWTQPTTLAVSTSTTTITAGAFETRWVDVSIVESVNIVIGAAPNCDGYFIGGKNVEPNPDISGIGVLAAFLVSAWVVWATVLYAFARGQADAEQVKASDVRFFRARGGDRQRAGKFRRAILVLSDQQLVTGIAILAAAFANLDGISVYHYTFAVRLAWLSSSVHLSTLLLLRRYLREHRRYLWFRVGGMTLLFVMLMISLLPTYMYAFQEINEDTTSYINLRPANGIPAGCFWRVLASWRPPIDVVKASYSPGYWYFRSGKVGVDGQSIISAFILAFTFAWRLLSMFDFSRSRFQDLFRDRPSRFMEQRLECPDGSLQGTSRAPRRPILRAMYLSHTVFWDTLDSFAGSIWFITINLSNGTASLVTTRQALPVAQREEEAVWTFGQIVPLVLLALPLIAAFEDLLFSSLTTRRKSRDDQTAGSISSSCDGDHGNVETKYPIVQGSPLDVLPQVNRSATIDQGAKPVQELLRSSWLYVVLFWELQVFLLVTTLWLPISQFLVVLRYQFWQSYYYLPAAAGVWLLTIIAGIPFSKAFRPSVAASGKVEDGVVDSD